MADWNTDECTERVRIGVVALMAIGCFCFVTLTVVFAVTQQPVWRTAAIAVFCATLLVLMLAGFSGCYLGHRHDEEQRSLRNPQIW